MKEMFFRRYEEHIETITSSFPSGKIEIHIEIALFLYWSTNETVCMKNKASLKKM